MHGSCSLDLRNFGNRLCRTQHCFRNLTLDALSRAVEDKLRRFIAGASSGFVIEGRGVLFMEVWLDIYDLNFVANKINTKL